MNFTPLFSRFRTFLAGVGALGLGTFFFFTEMAHAQETSTSYPKQHRLTFDEYESTLRFWRSQHPKWMTLERRAICAESLPVYLVKITDSSVPDKDKQVCLVTALHSGPERTGATGTLAVMEWLLGDSPDAVETRRKQIVLFMPIINPLAMFYTDRFRNDHGVDPYTGLGRVGKVWDIKKLSLIKPEDAPELAALVSVVDQYQPEVHADLHGTGLQEYPPDQLGSRQMYQGQIMTEITGSAYSNYALRPWDWRITEAMIAAGREAGFPSDRFEADAERAFWGPELAPLGGKLWHGMPLFYSAHYGYAKYHTMICTQEVSWEQSVVARMQGLFRIGNQVWNDERVAGYPVNRVRHFVGNFVTAVGTNSAECRRSRVELWGRQENFALGFLYPQTAGRASFVCAVNAAAKKAVAAHDIPALIQNLKALPGAASENLARFLKVGPELKLAMDTPEPQLLAAKNDAELPLEHGIGFRLRVPYQKAANLQVCLNGEPLKRADLDGYESWTADGFTQIQVNLSPAKARATGLFFITCGYEPERDGRMAWMPPADVQKQCATVQADATPPTHTDLPYGAHFHQNMDVWLAHSDKPSPMVFYVHGGGWAAQDKTDIHQHLNVRAFLNAGISVASINYRLLQDANAAKISPPVRWPLGDAARALQFVRSKAGEWHLDKGRIAVTGVSAGGCSSLWLAFHDDLADPQSADPVARESTRTYAAAVVAPVVSLDPRQVRTWIPNAIFGAHAFGFAEMNRKDSFEPFLAARDKYLPDIKRYSPFELVGKDAPPVFVEFPNQDKLPVRGDPQTDPSHSALSGVMLEEKMKALGASMELRYKNDGRTGHKDIQEYLMDLFSK